MVADIQMAECIFCKIISKVIPSSIIDENEHVLVVEDINKKAPIHYLIIPKIHIININDLQDTDEHNLVVHEMFKSVRKMAKGLPKPQSFTLVSNNGAESGQCVFHMHWHFLSGKKLSPTGVTL